MIHLYGKLYLDRVRKDVFEKLKINSVFKTYRIVDELEKRTRMRQKTALNLWRSKVQSEKEIKAEKRFGNISEKDVKKAVLNKIISARINSLIKVL